MSAQERYERFYTEVSRLVEKKALTKFWANRIARKANLRRGAGPAGARTVIDAYVNPLESNFARQYATDLSNSTEVRLVSQSDAPVYILYSVELPSGGLDASFSNLCLDVGGIYAASGTPSDWLPLSVGENVPIRLALSTVVFGVSMDPGVSGGPFSVLLQAR